MRSPIRQRLDSRVVAPTTPVVVREDGPMSGLAHSYSATLTWGGSTGVGYEGYSRSHDAVAPPAATRLELSADGAFKGDQSRLNPEVILLVAASSCQLLSFLAVAARARIDVVSYSDEARALMYGDEQPMSVREIHLRPSITVAGTPDTDRLSHLVEVAHHECFIANTLRSEIFIEATFHPASN